MVKGASRGTGRIDSVPGKIPCAAMRSQGLPRVIRARTATEQRENAMVNVTIVINCAVLWNGIVSM